MTPASRQQRVGTGSIPFVIVAGLCAIIVLRVLPGSGANNGFAGAVHTAAPTAAQTVGTSDSDSSIPADTLAQLSKQAPGTIIVPCSTTRPVLPDSAGYSINPVWLAQHPGFVYLKHGYCADSPSATPLPGVVVVVPAP